MSGGTTYRDAKGHMLHVKGAVKRQKAKQAAKAKAKERD
jgi:hypothetical protein